MDIRKNIAQWMKREGLTVNAVETKIGTRGILKRFLDGKGMNVDWVVKIVENFNVDPKEFFR